VRRANVLIAILPASLALVLVACGKDASTKSAAATVPATTTTAAPPTTTAEAVPPRSTNDGCRAVPAATRKEDSNRRRPRERLSRKRDYIATIRTNCGTIRIRLDVRRAPKTTASFAGLVRTRFFDGLAFNRIAKPGGNDFVIQGGDPQGNGEGGPGYIVVETPPRGIRYRRYIVAMAKRPDQPPGTSGSQFFIVTAADAGLDPVYALLGEVIGDKSAVQRIAAVPADPAALEAPLDPVVLSSVRITSRRR
jgi:cyclophilin family peptidyl-prolyl cis-trans isomerase